MKKTLIVIAVLLVAAAIALQLFLAYGLTSSLRQWVLPMAKERWDLDINLARVSVNLLGGSISIHDIRIINPPGFEDKSMIAMNRFKLTIGLLALLRGGTAEIEKAAIRDASLRIVRNRAGLLNIAPALDAIHNAIPNTPAAAVGAENASRTNAAMPLREIPDCVIRLMDIKTQIQYVDHKLSEPPFNLGLAVQMRLKDIANFGRDDVMSGTIKLSGHILTTDRKCAFDLNGRIGPIKDPLCLNFDLTGSIQTIDVNNFRELARRLGIESGQVSGTMTLYCQQGVFDPERSILHLTFGNVKLTGEQQARFGNIPFPKTFKALVPIKGTLTSPEIDFQDALTKTLVSKDTFDSIIKGVLAVKQRPGTATATGDTTAVPGQDGTLPAANTTITN